MKGIVNECFGESLSKNKLQESVNSGIVKIEQILQESKVEQPMYDFKIGLYSIKNPQKNDSCISKIIKTLTAMGNTHPGENGYVLLGIADDRRDADQLCSQYNMESKEFNGHYIVGVEKEAEKVHQDLDAYLQYLKQEIEKEPISESVKSHILRNIRYLCYHEHTIVLMTFSSDAPVLYDGKYYERRGANVHELSPEEIVSLTRRFPST